MLQTCETNYIKEAYKEIYRPRRAKKVQQKQVYLKNVRGNKGLRVSSLLDNYRNNSKDNSLEGDRNQKRDLASSMTLSYSNAGISSNKLHKKEMFST